MGRLEQRFQKQHSPTPRISLFAICTQHVQSSPATCWKQDIFALARHLVVYKSSHPFASSTPSFESNEILQQMMMMMMMMMMMIEDGGKRSRTKRDVDLSMMVTAKNEVIYQETMKDKKHQQWWRIYIYTYLHIIYNILIQCKCISVTRLPLGGG